MSNDTPVRTSAIALVALCSALCLAGCGGGGGGTPAALDPSGWWLVEGRPSGTSDPFEGAVILQGLEVPPSVWMNGSEFMRSGSALHLSVPQASPTSLVETDLTLLNANEMQGTMLLLAGGTIQSSDDLYLSRISAPTGALVCGGVVGTQTVSIHSATPWGGTRHDPSVSATTLRIGESQPYSHLYIDIEIVAPWPWAPGTYNVGTGPLMAGVTVDTEQANDYATAGFVLFSQISATHIRGNGEITLSGGGTLSFTYDIDLLY